MWAPRDGSLVVGTSAGTPPLYGIPACTLRVHVPNI